MRRLRVRARGWVRARVRVRVGVRVRGRWKGERVGLVVGVGSGPCQRDLHHTQPDGARERRRGVPAPAWLRDGGGSCLRGRRRGALRWRRSALACGTRPRHGEGRVRAEQQERRERTPDGSPNSEVSKNRRDGDTYDKHESGAGQTARYGSNAAGHLRLRHTE